MRAADGTQLIAVADGHGSARCYRAAYGAEMAVRTALDVLQRHMPSLSGHGLAPGAEDPIGGDLVEAWRRMVQDHFAVHPVGSLPDDGDPAHDDVFTAYGTTVLAAAASQETLRIVQVGDGVALIASTAQGPWRPMPKDPRLAADMTTSLALVDAEQYLHQAVVDLRRQPTDLVVLATDGYTNAFTDDAAFDQVGSDLLRWLGAQDPERLPDELPVWLGHSADVTGDDASMALLYRWPQPA